MKKISKKMFPVLCVACLCFGNENGLLSYIDTNRDTLLKLTEPIRKKIGTPKKIKNFDATPRSVSDLRRLLESEPEVWHSKSADIHMGILGLCNINMDRNHGAGKLLDDRVLFNGLVEVLDCGNEGMEKRFAMILTDNVYYAWLEQESARILQAVSNSTITGIQKLKLLALCAKGKERKALAGHELYTKLSLGYRARLGDAAAEKKLLAYSDSTMTYGSAVKHLEQLFIAGTRQCLISAIDFFNRDLNVRQTKGVYLKSIRPTIIAGFARLHPGDTLLFDELIRQQLHSDAVNRHVGLIFGSKYRKVDGRYTKKSVEEYVGQVIEWFLEKYNHKPAGVNDKSKLFYWVEDVKEEE